MLFSVGGIPLTRKEIALKKNGANRTLVLTGWGWKEYAVAAAVALEALNGEADVLGMSKRRLPEFLSRLSETVGHVYILGISLGGDPIRLTTALSALKARGVRVVWISAFQPETSTMSRLAPLLEMFTDGDTLLDTVGKAFHRDVTRFRPYAEETGRRPANVIAWQELADAAMFVYRNYQDDAAYASAIRLLAADTVPAAWPPEAQDCLDHYRRFGARELVGPSSANRALVERINRIAAHPSARVLILGESGTGKETVALQIHNKSSRRREPFCAFNCASLSTQLLEDRFFGHERGAFTGADRAEPGLFSLANGGTLFLDEIGELPPEAQGLLLRVLQEGRFMRLGGHEEIHTDVRLITATNRDLPEQVRRGVFRLDLYERLSVVLLRIPPLRERMEDLAAIADGWWLRNHKRHLTTTQLDALCSYNWPGNVRELQNLLERATVLGESDFRSLMDEHKALNAALFSSPDSASTDIPDDLAAATRLHVRRVLAKCDGNITRAASLLHVTRNTVRKYL